MRPMHITLAALLAAFSATAATFDSPDQAVDALFRAAQAEDAKHELSKVLGPGATELLESGDPVADRAERERFVRGLDERRELVKEGDDRFTLEVGVDEWPFPIPLVKAGGRWKFDVEAGKQELLDRRVGRNELAAIQAVLAYVDAQREYFRRDPDQDALHHYAKQIASTPGKRDGLYWETAPGEPPSPLGDLFAAAQTEGYAVQHGQPRPYHGYYFRVLTAQGPHAAGGAYDYVAKGELFGGFALVAWPAEYGRSGVMTYIVNQDGVVYEKNLGPQTRSIASAMKTYDPDDSWRPVQVGVPGT